MKKSSYLLKTTGLFFLILATYTSCLNSVEELVEENNTTEFCNTRSFTQHVKPLIDANCIQCHGQGGNSPNLTSFNNIKNNANSIRSEVASRRMPIGNSLTIDEVLTITCWIDKGALDN